MPGLILVLSGCTCHFVVVVCCGFFNVCVCVCVFCCCFFRAPVQIVQKQMLSAYFVRTVPVVRSNAHPTGIQRGHRLESILRPGNILSWRLAMKSFLRPVASYCISYGLSKMIQDCVPPPPIIWSYKTFWSCATPCADILQNQITCSDIRELSSNYPLFELTSGVRG